MDFTISSPEMMSSGVPSASLTIVFIDDVTRSYSEGEIGFCPLFSLGRILIQVDRPMECLRLSLGSMTTGNPRRSLPTTSP